MFLRHFCNTSPSSTFLHFQQTTLLRHFRHAWSHCKESTICQLRKHCKNCVKRYKAHFIISSSKAEICIMLGLVINPDTLMECCMSCANIPSQIYKAICKSKEAIYKSKDIVTATPLLVLRRCIVLSIFFYITIYFISIYCTLYDSHK